MLSEPSTRNAFLDNLRFDALRNADVEEGLSLGSLEVSAVDRMALRAMRRLPDWLLKLGGASRKFAAAGRRLMASAAGVCLVTESGSTMRSEVHAGLVMQRAWLALTERGLAVQPAMSIAILESVLHRGSNELIAALGRRQASELVGEFCRLVPEVGQANLGFLMRFGYAQPPTARTARLNLAAKVADTVE
jgi:hypothetical protein